MKTATGRATWDLVGPQSSQQDCGSGRNQYLNLLDWETSLEGHLVSSDKWLGGWGWERVEVGGKVTPRWKVMIFPLLDFQRQTTILDDISEVGQWEPMLGSWISLCLDSWRPGARMRAMYQGGYLRKLWVAHQPQQSPHPHELPSRSTLTETIPLPTGTVSSLELILSPVLSLGDILTGLMLSNASSTTVNTTGLKWIERKRE